MTTDADIRAQAADLIDGALDVLAERGLSCGGLIDEAGGVCVGLALSHAADALNVWSARDVAVEAIRALAGCALIAEWSDSSAYEDVTLTLKRAAHSLRTEVA